MKKNPLISREGSEGIEHGTCVQDVSNQLREEKGEGDGAVEVEVDGFLGRSERRRRQACIMPRHCKRMTRTVAIGRRRSGSQS